LWVTRSPRLRSRPMLVRIVALHPRGEGQLSGPAVQPSTK
jgi:hypothetical protein